MRSSDLLISSASPFIDLIYSPFLKKKTKPKLYFSSHAREHEDSSVEHVLRHCTRKRCPKEVAAWYYSFA